MNAFLKSLTLDYSKVTAILTVSDLFLLCEKRNINHKPNCKNKFRTETNATALKTHGESTLKACHQYPWLDMVFIPVLQLL